MGPIRNPRWEQKRTEGYVIVSKLDMTKNQLPFLFIIEIKQNPTNLFNYFIHKSYTICLYQVRVITVFTVFRLLTDFVCLYNYEFGLSLCKIVRSSVILLLPLYKYVYYKAVIIE